MEIGRVEILESDSNKKGAVFGRLMKDLFHSLGYNEPRVEIQKAGREIDIEASHRTEDKVAIAECKAHKSTIGGNDVNKFVGALGVEKEKLEKEDSVDVEGYFISLSGFKETAIEQERDAGDSRVVLLESQQIIDELVSGKILISLEKAIDTVKRYTQDYELFETADLVAFEKGWVWVLYYSENGQKPTHFTLVHAEGEPLLDELAQEVIDKDRKTKNLFNDLDFLPEPELKNFKEERLKKTEQKYFNYLKNELGEIHFEGLPTDKETGSVKVKLEKIFIPLHFHNLKARSQGIVYDESLERKGIGEILEENNKVAILANPGGGKSTLIKRIAISYAFPDRRKLINDELPDEDWFPIFIRCRELGDKVSNSITEIIKEVPTRAEISSYRKEYDQIVSKALQNGNALLLIDGLDEISDKQDRIAFVQQLRTFLATYPSVNLVITSRRAGFRVIGGSLAAYCNHYQVSNLTPEEIRELSVKWHKAIIDDTKKTIREAKDLAVVINSDRRIKNIASNPLLLTTLLFVKRWAGYLPTKKTVLYKEMIKLLLVTWNVEGHKQLDMDEAIPQLSYTAFWMSTNGQQNITKGNLRKSLVRARKEMPEILGYTNISPDEFIRRVESRSSLLILAGHKKQENSLVTPIYEFLHLSFQEYLTAQAIVKEYIPNEKANKTPLELIKPYVNNNNWKEIIPILAVLLGRDAKSIFKYLIEKSKEQADSPKDERGRNSPASLLGHCIANEVQISKTLLEEGIKWFVRNKYSARNFKSLEIILNSKYGDIFRDKTKNMFFSEYKDEYIPQVGSALSEIFLFDNNRKDVLKEISETIKNGSKEEICIASLGLMHYTFERRVKDEELDSESLEIIFHRLLDYLKKDDKHLRFSICWAIAWSGTAFRNFTEELTQKYCNRLARIWVNSDGDNIQRMSGWALSSILDPNVSISAIKKIEDINKHISSNYSDPKDIYSKIIAIYFKYLFGEEVDRNDFKEIYAENMKTSKTGLDIFRRYCNANDIDYKSFRENKEDDNKGNE